MSRLVLVVLLCLAWSSASAQTATFNGVPNQNVTTIWATGPIVCGIQTVSISGGAIATNYSSGCKVYSTLSHSATTTISAPTNAIDGGKLLYAFTQDGTGSNLVSWTTSSGGFDFGTSGAPTLSTAAGKVDYIGFSYDANLTKWVYLGSQLGN